ncbi:acyltransferase [Curtobacterium sp. MCBD17_008]|uniref:acyltransferase family protein n=1 Tax=Curtobacterium sp. MCBD17_008 TaxID=2175656 RepID=UPI000DAA8F5F|nr:acyltransferase [Curtobacterium sp. MCBD17_008]PZE90458.1 acyltransferase [Curtobacterium sp. MCBD17_008]
MYSGGAARRIEGLDLLRGLAILLVLVRHSWPEAVGTAGMVGVVTFFSLSGYLITGLLVSDLTRFGRVRYSRFYRNRALRLLPALVLMLVGFALVSLIWNPLGDRLQVLRSVIVALTYTMNIPFNHGSEALSHLWTLATEEQFYLVWPIVLALAIRFRRVALALIASAAAIVAAMIATMAMTEPTIWRIYPLPTSWCIAMVVGAAGYFAMPRLTAWSRSLSRGRHYFGGGMLLVLLGLSALPEAKGSPLTYLVVGPVAALATVALIPQLNEWQTLPSKWLTPLRALGQLSYAAYLWNYPIHTWMNVAPGIPGRGVLVIVLTLAAATVSWFLVERPVARLKERWDRASSLSETSAARERLTRDTR